MATNATSDLRTPRIFRRSLGRIQPETLLGDYMKRMGPRGSLHGFHDRLLSPFATIAPELMADLDKPASAVRAAANY